MKRERILLLLALIFAFTLSAKASDDPTAEPQPTYQPIKKIPQPSNPGKAKAPSLVMIVFSYDAAAETAYFDLPAEVEYIDIRMQGSETGAIYFGSASAYAPEWYQPLPAGEYIITCTADNGDVYEGYVYI